MPRRTFLVGGHRFRRRLSPFARKLGRNSKNASAEPFLPRQFITAHALETQIRFPVPRSSRGTVCWYNRRWNVRLFARRASKLCGRRHRRVNCLVSSPVTRRYIAELDCASSDLADKYYPECQPRSVITCRVVARKWEVPPYLVETINHAVSFAFYLADFLYGTASITLSLPTFPNIVTFCWTPFHFSVFLIRMSIIVLRSKRDDKCRGFPQTVSRLTCRRHNCCSYASKYGAIRRTCVRFT